MAAADKQFSFFSQWIVSDTPNEKGEYRCWCPLHETPGTSKQPSATINFAKGLFHCNSANCIGGMSIRQLRKTIEDNDEENPFGNNVVDIGSRRNVASRSSGGNPLTEAIVRSWQRGLLGSPQWLEKFQTKRGLSQETIEKYQLGMDMTHNRITIPIRDSSGSLVNVRKYLMDAPNDAQKILNHTGCGSPPRLYPMAALEAETVMVVEGELDALITNQHGIPAISGTGGAGRWDNAWSHLFAGKRVFICYDNDRDGRIGAKKVEKHLRSVAADVRVMAPLMEENKSDITDFFLAGGTKEQVLIAMENTPATNRDSTDLEVEIQPVQLIGSMDAGYNGKPIAMTVTVTGSKYPTFGIPHKVEMHCTMDAGAKCKVCPMFVDYEGSHEAIVSEQDAVNIARLIETPEEKRLEVMRKVIGAQRCTRLQMEVDEWSSVNEVFVATNIDHQSMGRSDYIQRRAYLVGNHQVETNVTATLTGMTWPNPKDSRNEFFAWKVEPTATSIDEFHITPEIADKLKIFQKHKGQKPIEKCREIAHDLSESVTRIIGRERMQIGMDLVWHSILNFEMEGKIMERGWLEFLVVGDTRTGKSETALRLGQHYRMGHIIGCENATFAGLVGGVKQVGKEWVVQWGEITVNDRRLIVMDEVSGLSQEIISRMSDVRSRGVAQVTAIETREAKARCRSIWISNLRKPKFVDEKKMDGIDIVQNVIGNDEDIARFDFAMSVRSSDVNNDEINVPRGIKETIYTSDLCHTLVLWAWSRKPHHVIFKGDAYAKIFEAAKWLGERYVVNPPLLQAANVKEKIARMAVAMAARTFSTDSTFENVVVTVDHVKDATNFLHTLYSYSNFGYYSKSQRAVRNREIAKSQKTEIRRYLLENKRVLEFLLDRNGSFRAQDLEEMAFMMRDEVNQTLSTLSDAKMISKDKSQIVLEPELQGILKEMRD